VKLTTLHPPILSPLDPPEGSEGSFDPLLLQRVYERLAEQVVPHLRVRMQRIRFLTAVAVGAKVCEDFDPEDIAADGVTPPWLVFEWYVTAALVRCAGDLGDTHAIPGRLKVETARRNDRAISAATYLKTPKIFGFTGIYKTAAIGLGLVTDDHQLDEGGDELLRAWEDDQGLRGFRAGSTGSGATLRAALRRAVKKGLEAGSAVRLAGSLDRQIAAVLWPDSPGPREKETLRARLGRLDPADDPVDSDVAMRRELIEALERETKPVSFPAEAAFLRALRPQCSRHLATRLASIDIYERLCRPVNHAFLTLRHAATRGGWIRPDELGASTFASRLASTVRRAAERVGSCQMVLDCDRDGDVHGLVRRFTHVRDGASLFAAVVEHHEESQRRKPPDGKRSWLERGPGGRILVRPAYAVDEKPEQVDYYLHDYRTPTLARFLTDLGRLRS